MLHSVVLHRRAYSGDVRVRLSIIRSVVLHRRAYSGDVRGFLSEGLSHAMAGRSDEACSCFAAAVAADPACVEAHANLGHMKNVLGLHEEAATHCDDALRTDGECVEALSTKGVALESLAGRFQQQVGTSGGASGRNPSSALRLEALSLFDRAVIADPSHWQSHDCLAGVILNLELGQRSQRKHGGSGAEDLDLSDPEALLHKGLEHAEEAVRLTRRGGTAVPPDSVLSKLAALRVVLAVPSLSTWQAVGEALAAETNTGNTGIAPDEALLREICVRDDADHPEESAGACWELACLLQFRLGTYDAEILALFKRAAEGWGKAAAAAAAAGEENGSAGWRAERVASGNLPQPRAMILRACSTRIANAPPYLPTRVRVSLSRVYAFLPRLTSAVERGQRHTLG
jgi:tetratricopeptide (TPR) repeat protein